MLYPETWDFPAPNSQIVHKANFNNVRVESQQFAHKISFFLPYINYNYIDLNFDTIIQKGSYYKVGNVLISDFLHENFCEKFFEGGQLFALSIGTRIDCDNCFCILKTGSMILSLNKETYEMLGVDGKVIEKDSRYHVEIDLKKISRKYRRKLMKNIERINLRFNILIVWEPYNETICGSSIAKYFHNLNYNVKIVVPALQKNIQEHIPIPNIAELDSIEYLIEWMGLYAINCSDDTICSQVTCSVFSYISLTGFFSLNFIEKLILFLKCSLTRLIPSRFWFAVMVQGFSDVPVVRDAQDVNYFHTCSDHGYVLLFKDYTFQNSDLISFRTSKN